MPGVGRTDNSFRKHELLLQVIRGQCHAAHKINKRGRILLIDLHAGDGKGAPLPQPDLFLGILPSRTTPEILCTVSCEFPNTHLLFCEKNRQRRARLAEIFPSACIIRNNTDAPLWITERYTYALIVSDPNGMGHNLKAMQAIAQEIPRSDFVMTINERAFQRVLGGGEDWATHPTPIVRRAYGAQEKRWMLEPQQWRTRLKKRQAAQLRTVIRASPLYHYRILVVAHTMSDVIKRQPAQWELFR